MARPCRIFTDEELQAVERYARIGSYDKTISVGLGIPETTLKRSLGAKIRHWRAAGKLDMRDNLHKQGENSPQTAIFIAKNELGMTDKQIIMTEDTDAKPQTAKDLQAAKAAAKAYNEEMAKVDVNPTTIKFKEAQNG